MLNFIIYPLLTDKIKLAIKRAPRFPLALGFADGIPSVADGRGAFRASAIEPSGFLKTGKTCGRDVLQLCYIGREEVGGFLAGDDIFLFSLAVVDMAPVWRQDLDATVEVGILSTCPRDHND